MLVEAPLDFSKKAGLQVNAGRRYVSSLFANISSAENKIVLGIKYVRKNSQQCFENTENLGNNIQNDFNKSKIPSRRN
jgi:hypothetical protein